jgi:hypothetical protein
MQANHPAERLQHLLREATSEGIEEIIAASPDFYRSSDYNEMATIEAQFCAQQQELVAQVSSLWGPPRFEGNWNYEDFPDWAAIESITLSYWDQPVAGVAYIAVVKHDKELPYLLVLGAKKRDASAESDL